MMRDVNTMKFPPVAERSFVEPAEKQDNRRGD